MNDKLKQEIVMSRVKVTKEVPEEDKYELLAEECCELAKAALKMQRIFRKANKPNMSVTDIQSSLKEEFTDVIVVADVLGLKADEYIYASKILRWANRLPGKDEE